LFFSFNETLNLEFFDLQKSPLGSSIPKIVLKAFTLALLVLLGYALYFICRKTPKRIWLFVLTLTGVTALALVVPDLLLGGYRSLVARYLIPSYLGVDLAIAYLFAAKLSDISSNMWGRKLWQSIAIVLVSVGVLCCAIDFQTEVTWSKELGKSIPDVARVLNQSPSPLVVGSPVAGDLLSLSYQVGSKVKLLVDPRCRIECVGYKAQDQPSLPKIPDGFSDVFLFKAGSYENWLNRLEKDPAYKLEPVLSPAKEILLWRVKKQ
jgi:uncharacterized membrane protein